MKKGDRSLVTGDGRGAALLCYRSGTEITLLMYEKKPNRYGFRAGPKAIRYNVNIASHFSICKIHSLKSILAFKGAKNSSLDLSHD